MGLDPVDIIEVASTSAARVLVLDELAKGVRFGSPADLVIVGDIRRCRPRRRRRSEYSSRW